MELSATIPGQARLASADPDGLHNMPGLRFTVLSRAFPILPSSYHLFPLPAVPPTILLPPPPPSPGSRIPLLQVAGPVTEVLAFSAWPHSDRCFTLGAHIQQKRSATAILVRPVCRGLPLCPRRGTLGIFLSLMGLKGLGPPARYLTHHSENWYKSRQRYQIMAEAWLGPAVWSFKPIGLARWHISCHGILKLRQPFS